MKTLEKYTEKRDFGKTPEPSGKIKKAEGNRFVIHKHEARRTHYDFRIELDGVLVCWAVPKMPVFDPDVKRLAVKTEDHPLDYINFEGVIPKGNYGAGTVIIWDAGRYYLNEEDEVADIEYLKEKIGRIGHIKIFLRGQKLTGYFNLFRTSKEGDKEQWIFTKTKDNYANLPDPDDEAVSFKTFDPPDRNKPSDVSSITGVEKKDLNPEKVKPMLATLVEKPFDKNDWIFELKLDGYRVIASKKDGAVNLISRYGNTFNEKYKVIAEALNKLEGDFIVDGEVVILTDDGKTDFQALQNITSADFKRLYFYVFDILWLNGYDIKKVPLIERKLLLKSLVYNKVDRIRYCDHIEERGIDFFNEVSKNNLEGIIAKRKTSTYREGARSDDWLKIKTTQRQEFIIVGYTPPQGSRSYFGALLTAVYENKKLVFTGRVGTGFNDKNLKKIYEIMQPLKTEKPVVEAPDSKHVQWIKPELICEVKFSSWTDEKIMRAPSFMGLRSDKTPEEVTLEKPETEVNLPKNELPKKVKITNPDKIFWKDNQIKKIDVINYYNDIADSILPYLINRPESLFRSPNGAEAPGFFQKDVKDKVPSWIETIDVKSDDEDDKEYMLCQDRETLVFMANMGCIEINPWNSSVPTLDNPDYVVFDLDPVEIGFDKVVDVAAQIKFLFDKYELPFFCKTSGSRGIHIYLPVEPVYSYEQGQNFVKLIETIVHQQMPDITSFVRNPNERKGRVYLDFLQNAKGKTMSCVYSLRPKPGAKVSAPIRWQELNKKLNPDDFTIFTMRDRIGKYGDIWKDFFKNRIKIEDALKRMG